MYVLIPNRPLGTTVRERATAFLRRRQPVEHTMLLEDQRVKDSVTDAQIEDTLRGTNPRLFWD